MTRLTSEARRRGRACGALAKYAALVAIIALSSCGSTSKAPAPQSRAEIREAAFMDTLQARTFRWFWELSDPRTGLTPDRAPTRSFVSVAATGFALTAYPIGAERGWTTRAAARGRVLATLRFFWSARQDTARAGATGYRGFFYHFLEPETGARFRDVELSTVDTALFVAGALFCQSYFDRADPEEAAVRALAESLYARVDWKWAQTRPPLIGHGWNPESGPLPYDWGGYNEAMLLYVLALGAPAHAVEPAAWDAWTARYRWGTFHGQEHLGFAPLFGHQYSHGWIDFRGIQDEHMGSITSRIRAARRWRNARTRSKTHSNGPATANACGA